MEEIDIKRAKEIIGDLLRHGSVYKEDLLELKEELQQPKFRGFGVDEWLVDPDWGSDDENDLIMSFLDEDLNLTKAGLESVVDSFL